MPLVQHTFPRLPVTREFSPQAGRKCGNGRYSPQLFSTDFCSLAAALLWQHGQPLPPPPPLPPHPPPPPPPPGGGGGGNVGDWKVVRCLFTLDGWTVPRKMGRPKRLRWRDNPQRVSDAADAPEKALCEERLPRSLLMSQYPSGRLVYIQVWTRASRRRECYPVSTWRCAPELLPR